MDEDTNPVTTWTEFFRVYEGVGWGDPWGFRWGVGSFIEDTYTEDTWSEVTDYG